MLASLISAGLPIALIMVMTGVGLGLTIDDFKRVVQQPKGFFIGAACQLLLLPFIALAIIELFGLTGGIAIGLFIIALCPGGSTSNLYSMLAKADVGLSVSLTAVIGFITPFTIPLLAAWAIERYADGGDTFSLPLAKTFIQLIVVGVIPVIVGMVIRAKWTAFAQKAEPWVNRFSIAVLALVILAIVAKLGNQVVAAATAAGIAALVLNLTTLIIGYTIGKLLLSEAQARTVGIEVGLQNGTMALLVTSGILQSAEMSMAPIIYSLLMFVTATLFTMLVKKEAAPA